MHIAFLVVCIRTLKLPTVPTHSSRGILQRYSIFCLFW